MENKKKRPALFIDRDGTMIFDPGYISRPKKITMAKTINDWSHIMAAVFEELYRVTKKGGWLAFEVGEVRNGKIKLEEHIVPLGINAGFSCEAILINRQYFTKTSNIWGIKNNDKGTNSNRIVIFKK